MNYLWISFLRIPEWLWCGVVYGHKEKNQPELMENDKGEQFWVDSCKRCGAQKVLAPYKPEPLVQITL